MAKIKIQRTDNFLKIQQMCECVLKHNTMGLIHGKSGVGKTTAVKTFADKNRKKGIGYYRVADSTISRKSLLEEILFALGGVSLGKSLASLRQQIIKQIRNNNYKMLIIDDANYLSPVNFVILNGIRETADIALLLVGTERLPQLITQGVRNLELEQVSSRIEYAVKAKEVDHTAIALFLHGLGMPDYDASNPKATNEFERIIALFYKFSKNEGQYRKIKILFDRAVELQKARRKFDDWSYNLFADAVKFVV